MKITHIILSTLLIFLSACSAKVSPSIAGEWKLVSYGDALSPTPALPNVDASLSFDENGQLSGNVGCNSFGGDYEINGDEIMLGSIVSTLMFCEATSSQESLVLGVLSDKTLIVQADGELLTLTSTDGTSTITLARK